MSRALLYCRQSIESEGGERSLSLDSQVTALSDRCQREGWTVVGVVRESALKGYQDVDERPGLADAIARAERGDYDVLLVWDLSRLARSLRLQEQWFWQFSRYGVEIVSHSEPESADILMRQIKGAFSEHRTREIASHVRRSLRERTRRGVPHGSAPFGYQRGKDSTLTPNDDAATVERIFRWRVEGRSLADIAAQLRREGIAGPTGNVWYRTTLTFMLENPVYTGTLCLAELRVPDAHSAIIDEDLWRRAQGIANNRPRSPRTKAARSWLEGLIEHVCGQPMYLTGGSAGRPTLVFRCRAGAGWAHPDITCHIQPRQLRADHAEHLAWEAVEQSLNRLPTSPRSVLAEMQRRFRDSAPTAEVAHREAAGRKSRAVARRARAIDVYLSGQIDRAKLDRELAFVTSEEAEADSALLSLPAPPDAEAIEAAWLALSHMRGIVADMEEADYRGMLARLGIVIVSPAGFTVMRSGPGQRADAGKVTIRFRPEYAGLLAKQRG